MVPLLVLHMKLRGDLTSVKRRRGIEWLFSRVCHISATRNKVHCHADIAPHNILLRKDASGQQELVPLDGFSQQINNILRIFKLRESEISHVRIAPSGTLNQSAKT
jgi:thiamine kinase-like enzyme